MIIRKQALDGQGATTKNEADWSDCNALQFWVVPDGKNQKTVIQINTLDGGSYEAYLNNYEGYTSTTEPLLVTIPFSEFVDKWRSRSFDE